MIFVGFKDEAGLAIFALSVSLIFLLAATKWMGAAIVGGCLMLILVWVSRGVRREVRQAVRAGREEAANRTSENAKPGQSGRSGERVEYPHVQLTPGAAVALRGHDSSLYIWADKAGLLHVRRRRPSARIDYEVFSDAGCSIHVDEGVAPLKGWCVIRRRLPLPHFAVLPNVGAGLPPGLDNEISGAVERIFDQL